MRKELTPLAQKPLVRMRVYGGESILLVWSADAHHVYVCTPDEAKRAEKGNYQPRLVGFLREHIIEYVEEEGIQ